MTCLPTYRAVDAGAPAGVRHRSAFTLIELMVVTVLIISLAGLALAGMGVARQRAKIDKTKSTIRKLHEIIVPHYESYVRRRVPLVLSSTNARLIAQARLERIRTLALYEMPDSWADVATTSGATGTLTGSGTVPAYAWTATARSYASPSVAILDKQYPSSECLYAIVSRGVKDVEVMEQFRNDEVGDVDQDSAPEFLDGWGRPIAFMRWPTGFVSPYSPIQIDDPIKRHDPFDPMRIEAAAFAVVPLIYSAGLDGGGSDGYGLVRVQSWSGRDMATVFAVTGASGQRPGTPSPSAPTDYRDNITNHDLTTK
jgi:hypothetical protein